MKSFRKSNSSGHQKNNVDNVFVCVENAGRCQMAEGFFTKYYEGYAVQGWYETCKQYQFRSDEES